MSVDLAHIRAQTAEIINEAQTITGQISEVETRLHEAMGMLAHLSAPATEMVSLASSACTPALGTLREAVASLESYAATLTENH